MQKAASHQHLTEPLQPDFEFIQNDNDPFGRQVHEILPLGYRDYDLESEDKLGYLATAGEE